MTKETDALVDNDHEVTVELTEQDGEYTFKTNVYEFLPKSGAQMISTEVLGMAFEPEQLFENPDGSRKKVMLYNTTIESMLQNTEKMLDKIEDVLKVFKDNPEVVLLWRPHPILKATLKSMRNEFFERYEQIEKEYIDGGWGIYDDTSDMYRTITLSDAYYGDWSSVVELYKRTGKPIMIQNVNIIDGV